jgi:hypothetical protein
VAVAIKYAGGIGRMMPITMMNVVDEKGGRRGVAIYAAASYHGEGGR